MVIHDRVGSAGFGLQVRHFSVTQVYMTEIKGYRYRLEPDSRQRQLLAQSEGCSRFLYNHFLNQRTEIYKSTGKSPSSFDQIKQIPALKLVYPWLKLVPNHVLQQAVLDLGRAFDNFFAKLSMYPSFKKRGKDSGSVRFPDPKQIEINAQAIKLPKLGWVRYRNSDTDTWFKQGRLLSASLKAINGHWFIAIVYEIVKEQPVSPIGEAIAYDANAHDSIVLSNGEIHRFPVATPREETFIKKLQKQLARQQRGSNRYRKTLLRLNKFRHHLSNRLKDAQHKLSTRLAKNHRQIVVEDLGIRQMTRSARGSLEAPGKNVRQKAGLNRVMLRQAHGRFGVMVAYKCVRYGTEHTTVPAPYTSQTCPHCGHISPLNRVSTTLFRCVQCGANGNAHVFAAINILAGGSPASARRESVSPTAPEQALSTKRVPTRERLNVLV